MSKYKTGLILWMIVFCQYVSIPALAQETDFYKTDNSGESWHEMSLISLSFPGTIKADNKFFIESNQKGLIAIAFNAEKEGLDGQNYFLGYFKNGKIVNLKNEVVQNYGDYTQIPSADTVLDIAINEKNQPVIVYKSNHTKRGEQITYSVWDGKVWRNQVVPITGIVGISIDKESVGRIFFSALQDSIVEIQKGILSKNGKRWNIEALTSNSSGHNSYPFAMFLDERF